MPPPQTQNGITLRIIDAGFAPPSLLFPDSSPNDMRPLFYLDYALPGPAGTARDYTGRVVGAAAQNTRLLQVSGPNGEPAELDMIQPLQRDGAINDGQRCSFRGVNPAWQYVVAEFETLDPSAPREAGGKFDSTVKFDKVPVPAKENQEVTVNQERTLTKGSKITLKTVRIDKKSRTDRGLSTFYFVVTPSPEVADMQILFDLYDVKNQNGTSWRPELRQRSLGPFTNLNKSLTQFITVAGAPRENDTSFTPFITIIERAPSQQQRKWYRRFRVQIPVAALVPFASLAPPPAEAPAPVLRVDGRSVSLEMERDTPRSDSGFDGLIWIKSRAPEVDRFSRWLVRGARARAAGKNHHVFTASYEDEYGRELWRHDGSLAAPNEHSHRFSVAFPTRPGLFDLEFDLEKARRLETFTQLRGVPLPAPGKTLEFREGEYQTEAVRIKRIFWFQNANDLKGLPNESLNNYPGANLAIIVEVPPLFPNATVQIAAFRAEDDAHRPLDTRQGAWRGDATVPGTRNTNLRTLLIPALWSSKSLDLWFNTVETAWSGQKETLVLKDVSGKG